MSENIVLVKEVIADYVYNILTAKYPAYFGIQEFTIPEGTEVEYPNIYWSNTVTYRPINATECVLIDLTDEGMGFGIDGEITSETTTNSNNEQVTKYYQQEEEHRILNVIFQVTSMKNDKLGLTDLSAQNLALGACAYIKSRLKSGSASQYFGWDNETFTPITVLTSKEDLTDIIDTSLFEVTKNRHTRQFSCKFRYKETGSRETKVATNAKVDLEAQQTAQGVSIEENFNINE